MDKKQYNNIINKTLENDNTVNNSDSLTTAREIFNNMGVALPNGTMTEVYDAISTDDYMGWRACTAEEAQKAANNGVAAIGISKDNIVVISAEDEEEPAVVTASVMPLSEIDSEAESTSYEYYSYSMGTTTIDNDPFEVGTYYINNKKHGKYLHINSESVDTISGTIASLGNSIRWKFEKIDDYYVIKTVYSSAYYLCADESNSISLFDADEDDIPDNCRWDIIVANGGGVLIRNMDNSMYLCTNNNGGVVMSVSTGEAGTDVYYYRVWRVIIKEEYGYSSGSTYSELSNSFSFPDIEMEVGQTYSISILKDPSNALWSNPSDFDYVVSDSDKVSINSGKITALRRGVIIITATHKVTNKVKSFEVFVKNSLINLDDYSTIVSRLETLEGTGLFTGGSVLYLYTVSEAANMVLNYDAIITHYCNIYRIPKEYMQAILFREIWSYSPTDDAIDNWVISYYTWKEGIAAIPSVLWDDTSTGVAQIFARTAIKALNNAHRRGFLTLPREYDPNVWQDVWEVWQNLNTNVLYNLNCCALVILDCQYEYSDTIPYENFFDLSSMDTKTIISRYNGNGDEAEEYGNKCFKYFLIFDEYNY
ncbi:MAG: hypothetical protein IKT70_07275 [Clostridia bacterium]|nr:hypothetical protein [Clostridia bacterium]